MEKKELEKKIEELKKEKQDEYNFVSDWYWNSTGCGQIVEFYRDIVNKKYDRKIRKMEQKLRYLRLEEMQNKLFI